jgi:hypothetical protein
MFPSIHPLIHSTIHSSICLFLIPSIHNISNDKHPYEYYALLLKCHEEAGLLAVNSDFALRTLDATNYVDLYKKA